MEDQDRDDGAMLLAAWVNLKTPSKTNGHHLLPVLPPYSPLALVDNIVGILEETETASSFSLDTPRSTIKQFEQL